MCTELSYFSAPHLSHWPIGAHNADLTMQPWGFRGSAEAWLVGALSMADGMCNVEDTRALGRAAVLDLGWGGPGSHHCSQAHFSRSLEGMSQAVSRGSTWDKFLKIREDLPPFVSCRMISFRVKRHSGSNIISVTFQLWRVKTVCLYLLPTPSYTHHSS